MYCYMGSQRQFCRLYNVLDSHSNVACSSRNFITFVLMNFILLFCLYGNHNTFHFINHTKLQSKVGYDFRFLICRLYTCCKGALYVICYASV